MPTPDDQLETAVLEEIDNRDQAERMADLLAEAIAAITGDDFGEHSSTSNPWQKAVDSAMAYVRRRARLQHWQVHPDAPAIWTDDQQTLLTEYQRCGLFHPLTCGGGGGPCSGVTMVVTPAGMRCPSCGRLQTQVPDMLFAGEWRKHVAEMNRLMSDVAAATRPHISFMTDDTERATVVADLWRLEGYDTFEGSEYPLGGVYGTEAAAVKAARDRLAELEKNQPSASSGGQSRAGIQDRVYVVRPDGSKFRVAE